MRAKPLVVALLMAAGLSGAWVVTRSAGPRVGKQPDGEMLVPTGQFLKPSGSQITFHGRPTDMALSPDGKLLAVKHSHGLLIASTDTRSIVADLSLPANDAYLPQLGGNGPCGIAWASNGEIWMTDAYRTLYSAVRKQGTFAWDRHVLLDGPGKDEDSAPWGVAIDPSARRAYVALSRNNALAVVDLDRGRIERTIPAGMAPCCVLLNRGRVFVTNLGGRRPGRGDRTGPSSASKVTVDSRGIANSGTVSVFEPGSAKLLKTIEVGLHPCGIAAGSNAQLFVSNANSDTISVIDGDKCFLLRTIHPQPGSPLGSAPNSVAAARDGTIYVCAGGDNVIWHIDPGTGRTLGTYPTAWYPDCVLLDKAGENLLVANLKGLGSRMRDVDPGYHSYRKFGLNPYDWLGCVSISPIASAGASPATQIGSAPGSFVPRLKHVLYIIKENQTYDGVLGDMPEGNGDKRLCTFGEDITPNIHALAREFTLFDNFYCNGVLSADGHQWTDEGNVSDYVEKNMGGFSRSYPSDGTDALAYVSSGFIWNDALDHGLSVRVYGEFLESKLDLGKENSTWADGYKRYLTGQPLEFRQRTLVDPLKPLICNEYPAFSLAVPDVYRARVFLNELAGYEKSGKLPSLMVMLLGNDHTSGVDPGFPTPAAAAADNDLALGRIVDGMTRSPFWKDTAIFVVEDDAQDGLDHVDGHRTVALCICPYTKRHAVSSAFCNQDGLLRTLERALGLPAMNRMDGRGPVMDCFERDSDLAPYRAKANRVPLDQMNPNANTLAGQARSDALASQRMDFSSPDRADEKLLRDIVWRAMKGAAVNRKLP